MTIRTAVLLAAIGGTIIVAVVIHDIRRWWKRRG